MNILQTHNALQNCLKSKNTEGADVHEETLVNILLKHLPHGSGIDCKWKFDFTDKNFICRNSYHVMNENNYYMHYKR